MVFREALVSAAADRWAGATGLSRFGWVFVGEGQRGQRLTQVPGEVGGEHADQHVGADAVLEAVVDRAQVQVVGFDAAEVAFDLGEVLVGGDHRGGVQVGRRATLVRST